MRLLSYFSNERTLQLLYFDSLIGSILIEVSELQTC